MNFEVDKKNGISGCIIELIEDCKFVRKSVKSLSYSPRLENQMKKQSLFEKNQIKGIKTPQISNYSLSNDIFYFDMEYISGIHPHQLFLSGDRKDVMNFTNHILRYLNSINENIPIDTELFKQKNVEKLLNLRNNSDYVDFQFFLINKIQKLDVIISPQTYCHGDFTLSNMIYYQGNIYLIDFLDSYIDSIVIDLVKLKQDLVYDWTIEINGDNYTDQEIFKIKQVSRNIWEKIHSNFSPLIDTIEFQILESMVFLRIEPYANQKVKSILKKIINTLPLYEKFNNSHDGEIK